MTLIPSHFAEPQQVELVLSQLDAIPPVSPVAFRILALTQDERSSTEQLVALIESEPPLAARILSLVDRAELGVGPQGVNIKNAVLILGFNTVRQVALALKVKEVFDRTVPAFEHGEFNRAEFWKHSLAVACAARTIAETLGQPLEPEEAFLAGLLHDLGKIALGTAMPKSFERIVRRTNARHCDIADVERELLGTDHAALGHRLAERWRLPSRLVECIWLHHQPFEALPASIAAYRHVQVTSLADLMAREQRIGYSGNHVLDVSSSDLAARLGLSEEQHRRIFESLADEFERRAAWIGAEHTSAREVYFRALLQTTEELTAAHSELLEKNKRLRREMSYFSALSELNRRIGPRASVREVCAAAAAAVKPVLASPAVLVFTINEARVSVECGFCGENSSSDVFPIAADWGALCTEIRVAVEVAAAATWIAPVPAAFTPIIDRFRGKLGSGPLWLLPIVREQAWVAGAVFSAPAADVAALRADADLLELTSAAIALAVIQAQVQGRAAALGEELVEANRKLVLAQREALRTKTLDTVVTVAAGAAHELNNPLAVISGHAQVLRDRSGEVDVREYAAAIQRHAQACSDIVTDLMDFARPAPPRPEAVALTDLLDSLRAELASAGLLAAEHLTVDVPSDTPPVWFDRQQLARLFRELFKNALEATSPSIRLLAVKASPNRSEEMVAVSIADNGRGMTADVAGRAMEPFFSHRPAGRGRGLGLARVRQWLHQGGGRIRIASRPDRGTTVELHLPMATAKLDHAD